MTGNQENPARSAQRHSAGCDDHTLLTGVVHERGIETVAGDKEAKEPVQDKYARYRREEHDPILPGQMVRVAHVRAQHSPRRRG